MQQKEVYDPKVSSLTGTTFSYASIFKVENAIVVELEDGLYAVNFVPYELGVHTVSVMYRDVDIPGSPFQFTVGY